jgi:hypothetical protein
LIFDLSPAARGSFFGALELTVPFFPFAAVENRERIGKKNLIYWY